MTLTPHPELPGYYTSSNGGWDFSLEDDGDIEEAKKAVLAWSEWLEFLVTREVQAKLDKLF